MQWFLLLSLSLLCVLLPAPLPSGAVDYYVTPTEPPNPVCPDWSCHTLDWYAMNTQELDHNYNITMLFLPGMHQLYQDFRLIQFTNPINFTMSGISNETDLHAVITGNFSLYLFTTLLGSNLELHNLSFKKIDRLYIELINGNFIMENCNMHGSQSVIGIALTIYVGDLRTNSGFVNGYVRDDSDVEGSVIIRDSNFFNNSGSTTVYLLLGAPYLAGLINCKFYDNQVTNTALLLQSIVSNASVIVTDSDFLNNSGSAIFAYGSNITFSCTNNFINNSAKDNLNIAGGALSLYADSFLYFRENTVVNFEGNMAEVGGAIYVADNDIFSAGFKLCSFQFEQTYSNISINFRDNNASLGGNDIYGASLLDRCVTDYANVSRFIYQVHEELFHFHNASILSSVSSDPQRLCLCENSKPNCVDYDKIFLNMCRYPGETFNISAALVGYDFGTSTGSVQAQLIDNDDSDSSSFLATLQDSQLIQSPVCQNLTYTIFSHNENTRLILRARRLSLEAIFTTQEECLNQSIEVFKDFGFISRYQTRTPVYIDLTLLSCPRGIPFNSNAAACVCNSKLEDSDVKCLIEDGMVSFERSNAVWLNPSYRLKNESSNYVILHLNCPFSYCMQESILVTFDNSDIQCADNHSGILCGACQQNYSLAIGSNKCLSCADNNNLSLIIFFIFAGFALVFFIKFLDLTVARGTFNGLIFYANIVWANQNILFPEKTNKGYDVLRAFIAWLNLDFGIETCFVQGLDAYWKTWLQFIFPLYIWLIAGVIILSSHYSSLVTKLFGKNSVPVLATLIYLSYAKLFRTIITVLQFTFLESLDGSRLATIWLYDGNVPFFGSKHAPLFVVAVSTLVVLWLPYTSFLLLGQWLKKLDHLKPFRWTQKLKPFSDAYFGPLKDKYHYWVGLLLLVRGILLIIMSVTFTYAPNINVAVIGISVGIIFFYVSHTGGVYKQLYITLLENVSFLNLIILSVGILYVDLIGASKAAVIYTSIGITVIQFIVIVSFHTFITTRRFYCKKNNNERDGYKNIDPAALKPAALQPPPGYKPNYFIQLRDSILEDGTLN